MIQADYFWRIVTLLAIGTFALRFSIIAVFGKIKVTERLKEVFTFIPAAVLPAIIAPMVFFHKGDVTWAFERERLFVLIVAIIVSYKSKSMFATVSVGLALLFLITQL